MDSAGFRPEKDYQGPQDLQRLPILTKETIRRHGKEAFLRRGADLSRYHSESTTGSTGSPLEVWRTPYARALQLASYMRVLLANNYRPSYKVLGFRRIDKRVSQDESILQRVGLLKWRRVDRTLPVEILTDEFLAFQPDVLYGNRIHLDLVCQELEKRGIRYGRLKLAIPGGEVVLKSHAERYREVLGGDVAVQYGSTELGTLAFQVAGTDGLRLCEDLTHFEFLDSDGNPTQPGQRSRIIVTDLTNPLMPFIRYDQGDWVVLAARGEQETESWSRLESVEGRQNDMCVLPDGSRFLWLVPFDVMNNYPGVNQFRVIQKTRSLFQIQLAADSDYVDSIRDSVISDFRRLSPASAQFEIVRVEQLTPDPTGKLRTLVCEADD
jgi:phenylacetate-coenzyme A ligase PaaK-like adenylate-forming protein